MSFKEPTVYWLDADVYIQTKADNGAYPFARVPRFWSFLSEKLDEGVVRSPKMVYDEIVKGDDDLATWFRDRKDRGLAVHASRQVSECANRISDYVVNKWKDRKAREFLKGADLWVLAHAMAMGDRGVVVSHESLRHQIARVKIPAVCADLNIERINVFSMLGRLGAKL